MSETAFTKSVFDTPAPKEEPKGATDEQITNNGDGDGVRQTQGQGQEGEVSRAELEAKARTMGWRPPGEYKGSAPYVDPEEFIKRGETSIPILRSQIADLRRQVEEAREAGKAFAEFRTQQETKKYQDRISELEARMAVAVEEADGKAFLTTQQELQKVQQEASESLERANKPSQDTPATLPPEVQAWQSQNPWITTEPEAAAVAIARGQKLKSEGYALPEILKGMEDVVKEKFPELFGQAPRQNSVQRGGRHTGTGTRSGGKTFNDLPPDVQATCDMLVRQKMVKSRESYTKTYFETYGE